MTDGAPGPGTPQGVPMNYKAKTMVLASFAADALALGAHWIYDTRQIEAKFGRVEDFLTPSPPTYHPTKQRGDLTHYGDQTLLLLRSLCECGGFDAGHFARRWRDFFATYTGYIDDASRQTLINMNSGAEGLQTGSTSTDLAGAARIAPLIYCYWQDQSLLIESIRQQTALTHNHADVVAAAEFFGRTTCHVLQGRRPADAMTRAVHELASKGPVAGWIRAGLDSAGEGSRTAIQRFGQMCATEAALPATVHLIATYEDRLEEGLIENVMAGGDSAGRGLLAGLVLGAYGGPAALPERWCKGLNARPQIEALLARLDQAFPPAGTSP
jgi:ADP-ribosylglycohydrolase